MNLDQLRGGKVAVLLGGNSAERAVSLNSGQTVVDALRTLGMHVVPVDPAEPDWAGGRSIGLVNPCGRAVTAPAGRLPRKRSRAEVVTARPMGFAAERTERVTEVTQRHASDECDDLVTTFAGCPAPIIGRRVRALARTMTACRNWAASPSRSGPSWPTGCKRPCNSPVCPSPSSAGTC